MRLLPFAALAFACTKLLSAAPSIAGIYNGASWAPPALPNSGIAQGSIFTLTGTGLGPATLLQATKYPLPTSAGLGGTTIKVQVGTVTETCIMIYTVGAQVAAILPSATPVGTGTLTLSYQGGSGTIAIKVLAANFGTFTLNEGGSGPGVVTDDSYNAITMIHAAHPGDNLVLWGTGLGAVSGDETQPPTPVDLGTGVQVLVGNQAAQVVYGGRSSSPGLDQINFVVPGGLSGCKVSIAVLVKGVTGNVTTTSIAPAGQTTCADTYGALTAANLQTAISKGSLGIGLVQMSRIGGGDDKLLGGFGSFALNDLIRSYGGSFGPSVGSCVAYEVSGTSLVLDDPVKATDLDAGAQLTISGPGGVKTSAEVALGDYSSTLAVSPATYLAPGNYTVSNGNGGANVGPFSWSMTLPSYVVPVNFPKTVNRAQDLTLSWTGGTPYSVVTILGYNGVTVSSPTNAYVEFICNAAASSGSFTIPAAILNLLPANGDGSPGVPGVNLQIEGIPLIPFSVAGIDVGIFSAFVSNGGVATLQ